MRASSGNKTAKAMSSGVMVLGSIGRVFLVPFLLLCEQRENQINLTAIPPFADIVKHKSDSERSEEYTGVCPSVGPSDHAECCYQHVRQNISLEEGVPKVI
jgi:hypothetical protein